MRTLIARLIVTPHYRCMNASPHLRLCLYLQVFSVLRSSPRSTPTIATVGDELSETAPVGLEGENEPY